MAQNLAHWISFCLTWGTLPINSVPIWAHVDVDRQVSSSLPLSHMNKLSLLIPKKKKKIKKKNLGGKLNIT